MKVSKSRYPVTEKMMQASVHPAMTEVKIAPVVYAMPDEDHEHLHIEVELPGVAKEDIMLSMHDDSFFVRASEEGVRYVGSYKKPQERRIEIPITLGCREIGSE